MKKTVKAKGGMNIGVTKHSGENVLYGPNETLKSNPKMSNAKRKAAMKKIRELKGIPLMRRL